jgi:hypothetical protein
MTFSSVMNMNQNLRLLPLLIGLLSACSNTPVESVSVVETASAAVPAPQNKKRHRHLPEGIFSVDLYQDQDRLHLLTANHVQGKKSLWYQFSDDGGSNWSQPVNILTNNLSINAERGKDAQITANGKHLFVIWMKHDPEARFHAGAMQAAYSPDGGQTWTETAAPPDWTKGPHGYFDLAAHDNTMHAVWLDSRLGKSDVKATQAVHYARSNDNGLTWQTNITLDALTCSCCWNTIKTDDQGNAYVLYRDKQPSDLAIGVIDNQQNWQRLSAVGAFDWQFEGCPHIGGGLDFSQYQNQSYIHAIVGTGHEQHTGVHYLKSEDHGKSWSSPQPMGDASALHADIAANPKGHVIAVWDMMSSNGLAVFYSESKDNGQSWSAPEQISSSGSRASHPRISSNSQGFLSVWTESSGSQQTLAQKRFPL